MLLFDCLSFHWFFFQSVTDNKFFQGAINKKKCFENEFLKKHKKNLSQGGARVLQYMCITVLFELVTFAFKKKLEEVTQSVKDDFGEHKEHAIFEFIPHYEEIIREVAFWDAGNPEESFHREFGYNFYVKFFLLSSHTTPPIVLREPKKQESSKRAGSTLIKEKPKKVKLDPNHTAQEGNEIVQSESKVLRQLKQTVQALVGRLEKVEEDVARFNSILIPTAANVASIEKLPISEDLTTKKTTPVKNEGNIVIRKRNTVFDQLQSKKASKTPQKPALNASSGEKPSVELLNSYPDPKVTIIVGKKKISRRKVVPKKKDLSRKDDTVVDLEDTELDEPDGLPEE